jgi:hypothetical protein
MRMRTAFLIALGVLSTLPAARADPPPPSDAARNTSTTPKDPFLDCTEQIAKDPQYAELAKKLPIKDGQISQQMLANDSVAMSKELPAIKSLYDRHKKCWEDSADFRKLHLPPEALKIVNDGGAAMFGIGADLYKKKISYGEANKRLAAAGSSVDAGARDIAKQYEAEVAALNATPAAQDAQKGQRDQQVKDFVQAPPQLAVPLHSISANCPPSGGATTCVTR